VALIRTFVAFDAAAGADEEDLQVAKDFAETVFQGMRAARLLVDDHCWKRFVCVVGLERARQLGE